MLSRRDIWKSAGSSGSEPKPNKARRLLPQTVMNHPSCSIFTLMGLPSWYQLIKSGGQIFITPHSSLTAWLHNASVLHKGNAKAWEVIPIQVSANSEGKLLATVVIKPDKLSLCLQQREKSCGFTQGPVQLKENKHWNYTFKRLQWKLTW